MTTLLTFKSRTVQYTMVHHVFVLHFPWRRSQNLSYGKAVGNYRVYMLLHVATCCYMLLHVATTDLSSFLIQAKKQQKDRTLTGTQRLMDPDQQYREFDEAFRSESISKDDKFEVFNQWLGLMEKGIKSVINFAKALPGFRQLDMNDQISLFKSKCQLTDVSTSHPHWINLEL